MFGRLDDKVLPIEPQDAMMDRRDLERTAIKRRDEDIESRAQPRKGQLRPFEIRQLDQRYDGSKDEATRDPSQK